MKEKAILGRNPNMVMRIIGGETILLPVYKSSKEINCVYTLNKDASLIWEMIDGKRTLGEIKKHVLKKFDTTLQETDKKIEKLLKDLKQIKALK